MKYRYLLLGLIAVAAVSCNIGEIAAPEAEGIRSIPDKVYATIDDQPSGVDTKTYADSRLRILWDADDRITLFPTYAVGLEYSFTGETGDAGGSFSRVDNVNPYAGADLDGFYAVYPHSTANKISADGEMTVYLPETQTYHENSFGRGANTMVSKTDDLLLKFKNVGGYITFGFTGSDVSIFSIEIKGNNNEKLAGKCKIVMTNGEPVVTMDATDATETVTLLFSTPVELSATEPTYFWAVLPPTQFTKGITFTVNTTDGGVFTKSSSVDFTLPRNTRMDVPVMEVVPTPGTRVFELSGSTTVPYIGSPFSVTRTFSDQSSVFENKLGIDYATFRTTYTFNGYYIYDHPATNTGILADYVGTMGSMFGTVTYTKGSSAADDKVVWEVDPVATGDDATRVVYLRFDSTNATAYVGVKIHVAPAPVFVFAANKTSREWYSDIDAESSNTIRLGCAVPKPNQYTPVTGGNVLVMETDINRKFDGYKPQLGLSDTSDPIYANFFNATSSGDDEYLDSELATETHYRFADTQPVIGDVQLYTNWWEGSNKLYVAQYDGSGQMITVTINGETVPVLYADNVVATIAEGYDSDYDLPTAKLSIVTTDVACKLLNLWSYTATRQSNMFYCNILARSFYGPECLPAGDAIFHARFLRPIDFYFTAQSITDAFVDGGYVEVGKFISGIKDWNGQDVIVPDTSNPGYYKPNVIRTVDMYQYYMIGTFDIDVDNAEVDNWDVSDPSSFTRLYLAYPRSKLELGTVSSSGVFTPYDAVPKNFNIYEFSSIYGIYLSFRATTVYASSFHIRVPVTFEYAWGTISDYVVINVSD